MATIRVNHTRDYVVMSNYHLRDCRLSLKAKGLLSLMLSLPPEWDYTVAGLVAINRESTSAITAALKELRACGYLVVTKQYPGETESGRIEYTYDIYEQPTQEPEEEPEEEPQESQPQEKQVVENQALENQRQLNIDYKVKSNKVKNNKIKNIGNMPPTVEEVTAYCQERGNNIDPQRFVDYYNSNGWKVGRNPMKDWKAAIRTWERNDREKGANGVRLAKGGNDLDDLF